MSISTQRNEVGLSEDVEETARVQLQHSPYRAIRRVSCRFEDGVLTLIGAVPTYHYKQLAQTAVCGIAGVARIENEIEVDAA
jgi:osmotically-inducible protein OsmY